MNDTKKEKKDWLINLAIETMGRHGIRKTTLDDIAAAANMATPSLYYYFRNKNEVIRAAISKVLQSLLNDIELSVISKSNVEDQLIASANSLYTRVRQFPFLIAIDNKTKSDVNIIACDLIDTFNEKYSEIIMKIIQKGNQNGSFSVNNCELAAKIIANCMWSLLLNNVVKTELDSLKGELEELSHMFINGLRRR